MKQSFYHRIALPSKISIRLVSEHIERIVSIAEAELYIGIVIILHMALETSFCTMKVQMREEEKTGW